IVKITSSLVQLARFSVQPILSLYVKELHGTVNIAFFSDLAFSVAGLGNLFLARRWVIIGDKIGYIKLLIALLFMAGIVYFPGAFVRIVWQLIIRRFLLWTAIGGIVPTRIAYIRNTAPVSMQGEVL